jgi:predicted RNA-binding protein with PIN domain
MIILIDGYNLLNHVFPGKKHALDRHRVVLIKQLGLYLARKPSITEIIVVFDGGVFGHAVRTVKHGVVIIESGIKCSADDWIISFASRSKGKELLVITLDRALREQVRRLGADWMSVYDFHTLMVSVVMEAVEVLGAPLSGDLTVYEHEDDGGWASEDASGINKQALALLMEQGSLGALQKKDDKEQVSRKGKGYTPSKLEKQIAAKIKKLK